VKGTRGAEVVWRVREVQRWCGGYERRRGGVEGTRGAEVVWKAREARRPQVPSRQAQATHRQ
jgi:hypothetical protein